MFGILDSKKTIQKKFSRAIDDRNIDDVRKYIEKGADVNVYLYDYKIGSCNAVQWCLAHGCLFHEDIIKLLIEKGATYDKQEVLQRSSFVGANDLAGYLLTQGADPLAADRYGLTPLHSVAAFSGHLRTYQNLSDKAGRDDVRDKEGRLPIHMAVLNGHTAIFNLLIGKTPDAVNAVDDKGVGLLHMAASRSSKEVILTLLEKGGKIDALDRDGNTPLHCAAAEGSVEIIKLLLANGHPLHVVNAAGETLLHTAARKDDQKKIKFLLDQGMDPAAVDKKGNTALHVAVDNHHHNSVPILCDSGVDIMARNAMGKTALDIALEKNHRISANLLKEYLVKKQLAGPPKTPVAEGDADSITLIKKLSLERQLVETFNFKSRERVTFIENSALKSISAPLRESFDHIRDKEPIKAALAEFVKKGGKADPSVVYADPRGQKKPFPATEL